ncbi:MAG: ABC transporter permease [Gemmatimonadota bacterium]|nr:MAG: ABC transporter permease [Gemmatimonadota bacterium]
MSETLLRLSRNRRWRYGIALLTVLGALAALAPLLAPYDPTAQLGLARQLLPPSAAHPFGTDIFGRDVLSRVIYGARISFVIALSAVLLSVIIGTSVGVAAGYGGRLLDGALMRTVDAALAVPRVLLLLLVLALWERVGVASLIIILGSTSWFGVSRIVRAEVLSVRERGYMEAAKSLGVGQRRILSHHLLPNITSPIIIAATLGMGQIVLIEAGLSFLGLGIQEPTASLGRMMQAGSALLVNAPWTSIFPGAIIVLTVIGFSLVGDGFRDTLDPRTA